MSSRINTYEDLRLEKRRLEALLKAQKELIRHDIDELKEEFAPMQKAVHFVSKLSTRDASNPILTGLSDMVIDLVVKKGLLARAGWLTRIAIPYLTKNFSSHFLAEYKDVLLAKLAEWLNKGSHKAHQNGQTDQPLAEEKNQA